MASSSTSTSGEGTGSSGSSGDMFGKRKLQLVLDTSRIGEPSGGIVVHQTSESKGSRFIPMTEELISACTATVLPGSQMIVDGVPQDTDENSPLHWLNVTLHRDRREAEEEGQATSSGGFRQNRSDRRLTLAAVKCGLHESPQGPGLQISFDTACMTNPTILKAKIKVEFASTNIVARPRVFFVPVQLVVDDYSALNPAEMALDVSAATEEREHILKRQQEREHILNDTLLAVCALTKLITGQSVRPAGPLQNSHRVIGRMWEESGAASWGIQWRAPDTSSPAAIQRADTIVLRGRICSLIEQCLSTIWRRVSSQQLDLANIESAKSVRALLDLADIQLKHASRNPKINITATSGIAALLQSLREHLATAKKQELQQQSAPGPTLAPTTLPHEAAKAAHFAGGGEGTAYMPYVSPIANPALAYAQTGMGGGGYFPPTHGQAGIVHQGAAGGDSGGFGAQGGFQGLGGGYQQFSDYPSQPQGYMGLGPAGYMAQGAGGSNYFHPNAYQYQQGMMNPGYYAQMNSGVMNRYASSNAGYVPSSQMGGDAAAASHSAMAQGAGYNAGYSPTGQYAQQQQSTQKYSSYPQVHARTDYDKRGSYAKQSEMPCDRTHSDEGRARQDPDADFDSAHARQAGAKHTPQQSQTDTADTDEEGHEDSKF